MTPATDLGSGEHVYRLRIEAPPRTKKNRPELVEIGARCKVCRRGARTIPQPAKTAREFAAAAVPQLRQQWAALAGAPLACEVNVAALVCRDARRGDLLGYLEAIADALEEAGVLANDALAVSWDGSRFGAVGRVSAGVEITLTPLPSAQASLAVL